MSDDEPEFPLCPRCGLPMVPTTERGARWYCRPCVLLVIPANTLEVGDRLEVQASGRYAH